MPLLFNQTDSIRYLQQFLQHNKARGMIAELALETELQADGTAEVNKILPGGWLISPNVPDPYRYRYIVFVLPHVYKDGRELRQAATNLENDRGWQALATFLSQSAVGVVVSGALQSGTVISPAGLGWHNFVYSGEKLQLAEYLQPFASWPGTRGRASKGDVWEAEIQNRFLTTASDSQLTALTLRQAFYYGYLKQQLRKPVADPYDADAFIVSYRGAVMPVEIKEKSPTEGGAFGIDAGRILMMLRLCLATDSNALYLIREVGSGEGRQLKNWRYITLSDMIMGCSWNLQAGGRGMGGGATQTVMMAGSLFGNFGLSNLSEDWLATNGKSSGFG